MLSMENLAKIFDAECGGEGMSYVWTLGYRTPGPQFDKLLICPKVELFLISKELHMVCYAYKPLS